MRCYGVAMSFAGFAILVLVGVSLIVAISLLVVMEAVAVPAYVSHIKQRLHR